MNLARQQLRQWLFGRPRNHGQTGIKKEPVKGLASCRANKGGTTEPPSFYRKFFGIKTGFLFFVNLLVKGGKS